MVRTTLDVNIGAVLGINMNIQAVLTFSPIAVNALILTVPTTVVLAENIISVWSSHQSPNGHPLDLHIGIQTVTR